MAEQFYTLLTKVGKAKIANASALGTKLNLSKFQVGDSNGSYYNPTEEQTELKNKVWEGVISSITVDENNPNWIVLQTILPGNIGGFMIREAGVFDSEGNLIAIGKYPETYKPQSGDGSTKDLVIKMILEVSNASSVTLKVDPTVILATKKDIEILENKIKDIKIPVTSVNNKTGAVELSASDVGAYSKTEVDNKINEINIPVTKVNGKTGDENGNVIISASDVEAYDKTEVDNKFKEVIKNMPDLATAERKTYTELKALKDGNKLGVGKTYILTDYRTKYKQPSTDVIKTMEVEELVLRASSPNAFEPVVFSSRYPQDTIWYDFNKTVCEDNSTPRNGFITRRYDHISGNNCPHDWRTILWARWKPDPNQYYWHDSLTNYSVWTSGQAYTNVIYKAGNQLYVAKNTNIPKNATDTDVFECIYPDISIGMLISDRTKVGCYSSSELSIKRGELQERLTFLDSACVGNVIGSTYTLVDTVFGGECQFNHIGDNCSQITLGNSCYGTTFGSVCGRITLMGESYHNYFGGGCLTTYLGRKSSYNTFKSGSSGNYIGERFYCCTLGSYCNGNTIGSSCQYVNIEQLSSRNLMNYSDLYRNQYPSRITQNKGYQYIHMYLDGNSQIVYKQLP